MSEGDDGPASEKDPPGPSYGDQGEGAEAAPFKNVEQPAESWSTLETTLSPDEVRASVAAGLERFRVPYTLRNIRSGFVLRTAGKKPFIAEVALTGWEEGTRIHISLPRSVAKDEADVTALREFLEASLRWEARRRNR